MLTVPMRMLLLAIAGLLNEDQRVRIEFLEEQVRVFQELHGGRRLRFNNDRRRRLAAKGKRLGRGVLRELVTIVTPDTILRWHRELVARKYDGSGLLHDRGLDEGWPDPLLRAVRDRSSNTAGRDRRDRSNPERIMDGAGREEPGG